MKNRIVMTALVATLVSAGTIGTAEASVARGNYQSHTQATSVRIDTPDSRFAGGDDQKLTPKHQPQQASYQDGVAPASARRDVPKTTNRHDHDVAVNARKTR